MRHFFAQVAGESHRNDDGSARQTIIASCRVGEPLILDAEPDNPEDENAVRVLRQDGKQIGYLERAMAARLVDDLSDFTLCSSAVRNWPVGNRESCQHRSNVDADSPSM